MTDDAAFEMFFSAYVEAALFSTTYDNGKRDDAPMDSVYTIEDLHVDTRAVMEREAREFYVANYADIKVNIVRAGRDFWLTRCRHGAGFWDGDWPEAVGARLTSAAEACGERNLYVDDDGYVCQDA